MYLLEKFHLVQFYLFSAQTLNFGRSSAIVAPNGSGKSAVLDALQIVLHGGDQHAIDLNAQSGASKDGRSIREYLLGYYRDNEHVRDHSTCYLTLVFRDSTGALPVVSAGISLGASLNEAKHRVYGTYILPGVDLKLEEHTQTVNGQVVPLAFNAFKELARDLAKGAGHKPEFPEKTASEFVRMLLFKLRANQARGIDHVAFSKALKNALNLKDVPDASDFVRERIIEPRPISVVEFRHQVETFHDLKRKIAALIERIAIGQDVLTRCKKAVLTRMRKFSYGALSAELQRDAASARLENALEKAATAQSAFQQAQQQAVHAEQATAAAERRAEDLRQRGLQEPGLTKARDIELAREQGLAPLKRNVATELRRVIGALSTAHKREGGEWELLVRPWRSLLEHIQGSSATESMKIDAAQAMASLRQSHQLCTAALARVTAKHGADADRLERAKGEFKNAAEQLQRAKLGKTQLPDAVMTVRRLLQERGIEATPVCDLVKVADQRWAPAIEGFLRTNTYALLVEPERVDEALEIYAAIPDGYNPFGVKIVQPRRAWPALAELPERALARLIHGQNEHAVGFLRSRLGRLVELEKATSQSKDGLTQAGMLVNHGSIERLWLPPANAVTLGQHDARRHMDMLARERQRLSQELELAVRAEAASAALLEALRPLISLPETLENLERWLAEHQTLERELDDKALVEELEHNPDLLALRELIDAAARTREDAKRQHTQAVLEQGSAETTHQMAQERVRDSEAALQTLAAAASKAMLQAHVDAGWIDERRTTWESSGLDLEEMLKRCAEGVSKETANHASQESEVRVATTQYVNQYQWELTIDPTQMDALIEQMQAELERLQASELATYQDQAEEAYGVAVRTFRSRIAANLRSHFDDMERQLRDLDSIMSRLPPFTNDERYYFSWSVNPEHKALYQFIMEVADRPAEEDLFNDPVNTPEQFRALLEEVDGPSQALLRDYRTFFTFDVKVKSQGQVVSTLKSRMEKGSGGEHRAPLFVVAGAALAAAYGKLQGDTTGMSLILFDELGDKIDGTNTKAVFEYLHSLGLQTIVAAPDDALGKINESIDGYVELYRDGAYLSVQQVDLGPMAQELLVSDSWISHPHLLEQATQVVRDERGLSA